MAINRGDIVWIDLNPQAGHEQANRRPAIVLSPASYNDPTKLAVICPITNQPKGYPYEVSLPPGLKTTGVILADQVKSLDWNVRNADFIEKAPLALMREVTDKIKTLIL